MNLSELIKSLANELDAPYELLPENAVKISLPVFIGDKKRNQSVVGKIITGLSYFPDQKTLIFASVVGQFNEKIDLKMLIRENENMLYSRLSLDEDDTIVVYGYLSEKLFENLDSIMDVLKEVAYSADRLEEIYFNKDKN